MSPEPGATMRWACAVSDNADGAQAAAELAAVVREKLGPVPVDLCLAFFTTAHVAQAEAIAVTLKRELQPGTLAGASARGVVAREREIETGVALSVIAGRLPGVGVQPFVMLHDVWREPMDDVPAFDMAAPGARGSEVVLMCGDPFSLDMERVLAQFHRHAPGVRVVGGMASAGMKPRSNVVFLNEWISAEGGFAISLHGDIRADVVVSQGCAPVGPALDVTHVEGNVILTLDGQPALERAEEVLRSVPESDRHRLDQGLFVGRPARGDASGRGDYLIRNLLGADRERGAIAVADHVRLREKIRLHVRDAQAATEDLEMLLAPQEFDVRAEAAVLFECNGRGTNLFGQPHHDIACLQSALRGPVPVSGMFCAGEIGPVGERNFMHGHTASIAILRPRG
ncbi:MAG: FIST C-terminal domain-containing protein [Candidatus Eisenbacteria bacterium]|nr:FIST C-terminal domain-containing protein [Candidatus Eisenbacteria bacterium]